MLDQHLQALLLEGAITHLQSKSQLAGYKWKPAEWAEDVLNLSLWSKQKDVLQSIVDNKKTAVKSCHTIGKFHPVSEVVPTPRGFRRFGDLRVGDYVFDESGYPTQVTYVTPDQYDKTYRVTFDDGSTVLAGGPHLWQVQDLTKRRRSVKDWRDHWDNTVTLDTEELIALGLRTESNQFRWRIPTARPIQLPENTLPVDPYIYGLWLGDGSLANGNLYGNMTTKAFYRNVLDQTGFPGGVKQDSRMNGAYTFRATGLKKALETHGLFSKEGIDNRYLWSSETQRRELLAGLMDSDGFAGVTGSGLDMTNEPLLRDVAQLIRSLGVKVNVQQGVAGYTQDGIRHDTGTRYRLAFCPTFNPGKNRNVWVPPKTSKSTLRAIMAIEPVSNTESSRCIVVDNPRHLYLITENFIPTHNTFLSAVAVCWWVSTRPNSMVRTTAPTSYQVHELLWEEVRKMHNIGKLEGTVNLKDVWKRPLFGQPVVVASGKKPSDTNIHAFHGVHRPDGVLTVIDEGCHDDQTDVLTNRGWLRWSEVTLDDELLTMNPETQEARWSKPERLISYEYDGDLWYGEAKGTNFAVTPNHEMYYGQRKQGLPLRWRKSEMQDMALNNRVMKKAIEWTGCEPEWFAVPGTATRGQGTAMRFAIEDWAEFLGWFASEGSIAKSMNTVSIAQKKTEGRNAISALLTRMGVRFFENANGFGINHTQLAEFLVKDGRTCDVKRLPRYVQDWSPRLLNILLDAFVAGDGYVRAGQDILYTSCKELADDLQEAVLRTGVPSVVKVRALEGVSSTPLADGRRITSSRDGYVVTRSHHQSDIKLRPETVSQKRYQGTVYCATMERDHLLFTRRAGYTMWSGNCGVPQALYTAADAISTGKGDRVLAVGNPDDPDTEFGRIFGINNPKFNPEKPAWNLITVSAFDTPNFTGEKVAAIVADNLIQPEWVEARADEWGEDSARYLSKILAEFPEQSNDAFFKQSVIDKAYDTEIVDPEAPGVFGVDPSSSGNDHSVVALNRGGKVRVIDTWDNGDIVDDAERVLDLAERHNVKEIRIDAVGYGEGFFQYMARHERTAKLEITLIPVKGSYAARDKAAHHNARAEQYDNLRLKMKKGEIDLDRFDEKIKSQLLAIRSLITNKGAIQIESKEDMRARGSHSPDELDAVVYAVADFEYLLNETHPTGTKVYQDTSAILEDTGTILDLMSQF